MQFTTRGLGLFHKTLRIRKLQICSYSQILTVNLLVNCQNSVMCAHFCRKLWTKTFYGIGPWLHTPSKLDFTFGQLIGFELCLESGCFMFERLYVEIERPVVNLINHFTIVIYDSRVVWLGNCPYYDSRVSNYDRKMFIRLATEQAIFQFLYFLGNVHFLQNSFITSTT